MKQPRPRMWQWREGKFSFLIVLCDFLNWRWLVDWEFQSVHLHLFIGAEKTDKKNSDDDFEVERWGISFQYLNFLQFYYWVAPRSSVFWLQKFCFDAFRIKKLILKSFNWNIELIQFYRLAWLQSACRVVQIANICSKNWNFRFFSIEKRTAGDKTMNSYN